MFVQHRESCHGITHAHTAVYPADCIAHYESFLSTLRRWYFFPFKVVARKLSSEKLINTPDCCKVQADISAHAQCWNLHTAIMTCQARGIYWCKEKWQDYCGIFNCILLGFEDCSTGGNFMPDTIILFKNPCFGRL